MAKIEIDHNPSNERLDALGIYEWPVWTKEVSTFPWHYEEAETCLFLGGDVVVTPEGEPPITMGKGDLVTFPAGMSCTWEIRSPVKKHYKFG